MKRNFVLLFAVLCAVGFLSAVVTADVPMLLTHQGRLLDGSDNPVSGTRHLIFRIYETEFGGSPLWTETHLDVPVTNGLFNVTLGSTVTISGDLVVTGDGLETERYLSIQVEGDLTELSPRRRLTSSAYSLVSSRVSGDIQTLPGALTVKGQSGSTTGTIRMAATPDTSKFECASDANNDGNNDNWLFGEATVSGVKTQLNTDSDNDGFVDQRYVLRSGVSGVSSSMAIDDDNDGEPEFDNSMSTSASGTEHVFVWNSSADLGSEPNRQVVVRVTPSDASQEITADLDGDGIVEHSLWGKVDNSDVRIEASSRFGSGPRQTTSMDGSFSHASSRVVTDLTDDGIPDLACVSQTDSGEASIILSADLDGDGSPEYKIADRARKEADEAKRASLSDPDDDGDDDFEASLTCDATSASTLVAADLDGDGNPEYAVKSRARHEQAQADQAKHSVTTDTDSDGIPDLLVESLTDSGEASTLVAADLDGDGNSEYKASGKANKERAEAESALIADPDDDGDTDHSVVERVEIDGATSLLQSDTDGDGLPDFSSELSTSSGGVEHRFIWASALDLGSEPNKEVLLKVTPFDATSAVGADSDGDGIQEKNVGLYIKDVTGQTSVQCSHDDDDDGDIDQSVIQEIGSTGPSLKLQKAIAAGDAKLQAQLNDQKASISVVPASAGTYAFDLACGESSGPILGTSALCFTDPSRDTTIIVYGDGRVGIGVSQPSNPIEHSSGAHLTAGGDWTNASDESLKENFSDVNGEELLDKIEDLSIKQWNYKNEDESVIHIGPTAQDFKTAFGVGSDDKTISTIDPSGIALAAIKELKKQNCELKSEIEILKQMVSELMARK